MLCRKVAKRSETWYLASPPPPPPPPQEEDIPVTKRPRLEIPTATATAGAATKTASPDVAVALPPPPSTDVDYDDDDGTDANIDIVMDTQSNPSATRATARWTPAEDAKLTGAIVRNTCKTKGGKKYIKDWAAISALVPGRTKTQCSDRWQHALKPSITRSAGRVGKWVAVEDSRLKDAVQMHGGKNWGAIAALVPGRSGQQCRNRWRDDLDRNIDQANGKWTEDEDSRLKDAVHTHGGKNWGAIAALVLGRTVKQCWSRWHDVLDPTIDRANGRMGTWAEDEDINLKDAVQTHGGKNWDKIAALIPGRSERQCSGRWNHTLKSKVDRANRRAGKWTEDELMKLKDAVQTHGGKDWGAFAALIPGRTGSRPNERAVPRPMAKVLESQHRPGEWTYG
jgi:hypothetical protein